MSLEVGLVGLPGSGKTTLFNALTRGHVQLGEHGKPHVGMAPVADDRLPQVAAVIGSPKATVASIRLVDPAGTGAAQLGALRPADALLAVLDAFSSDRSPEAAIAELELELVVADRDHVERRLDKVRRDAKSGAPEHKAEVAQLEVALAHLEAGRLLRDFTARLPEELEPLTTKPLIPVVNGPVGIDAAMSWRTALSVLFCLRTRASITRWSAPVSIRPGSMLLTVMPSAATSRASVDIAPVKPTRTVLASAMFG